MSTVTPAINHKQVRRRLTTALAAIIIGILLSALLSPAPAHAASATVRVPTVSGGRIWASVSVYNTDGRLSRACARLWRRQVTPWGTVEGIVIQRCISTPGTASHFFSSGSTSCGPGFWYTQVVAYNDAGRQVISRKSREISLGFC
jgi:hypothetical protein